MSQEKLDRIKARKKALKNIKKKRKCGFDKSLYRKTLLNNKTRSESLRSFSSGTKVKTNTIKICTEKDLIIYSKQFCNNK